MALHDWFSMGGYGFYVWSSYALFVALLLLDLILPRLRERATLRRLQLRLRRDANKDRG